MIKQIFLHHEIVNRLNDHPKGQHFWMLALSEMERKGTERKMGQ